MDDYVPTKTARQLLGITSQTLRNWADKGKIHTIFTPSAIRLYSRKDLCNILGVPYSSTEKRKIAYCRVSSPKQKEDLERQKDFFRTNYPDYEVVTDIGSGINWKRKGFCSLLESAMQGDIEEIVVAHRDRLCRFAFDLVKFGLKGWDNLLDSSGAPLPFSTEEYKVPGVGSRPGVALSLMKRLPLEWLVELADVISRANHYDKEEEKN